MSPAIYTGAALLGARTFLLRSKVQTSSGASGHSVVLIRDDPEFSPTSTDLLIVIA